MEFDEPFEEESENDIEDDEYLPVFFQHFAICETLFGDETQQTS